MNNSYNFLAIGLFFVGLIGVISRRDLISLILNTEIMLSGILLLFAIVSRNYGDKIGSIYVIFATVVFVAHLIMGLCFLSFVYKRRRAIFMEDLENNVD